MKNLSDENARLFDEFDSLQTLCKNFDSDFDPEADFDSDSQKMGSVNTLTGVTKFLQLRNIAANKDIKIVFKGISDAVETIQQGDTELQKLITDSHTLDSSVKNEQDVKNLFKVLKDVQDRIKTVYPDETADSSLMENLGKFFKDEFSQDLLVTGAVSKIQAI